MSKFCLASFFCLVAVSSSALADTDSDQQSSDEQTLKVVQVGIDGPSLLDFFKKRTVTDAEQKRVDELIKQLGDEDFQTREKAKQTLISLGPVVIKPLNEALKSSDLEVVQRAENCLQILNRAADPSVAAAAVRLLARKKPEGAAETLLAYLPYAGDDSIIDELRDALPSVAIHDGKPDKALIDSLEDKSVLRRAAAAEALARSGPEDMRAQLKKLLGDKETTVRLWTAMGFLQRHDPDAVPALIDLLGVLDREQAYHIEDALAQVAGEKSPSVALGTDEAGRAKCRDAWKKWWDDVGKKIDLAKVDLDHRQLGYTLVIGMDFNKGKPVKGINGKVQEIGQDGKVRWEITGLKYAIDARVIGHDRVLIVEYSGRSVTERNFQGEVLWKHDLTVPQLPVSAQRLPNGNTFIACRNALIEVDKDGKEVLNLPRTANDVLGAEKMRNGQFVVTTNTGTVQFLDGEGKELRSLIPGMQTTLGGGIDVLPNGHIVAPLAQKQKVAEFDADGKVVWEADARQATHALRLPNGHTLVASMFTQEVVELDQAGKEVWKQTLDGIRLLKARRR
jgi:HEAT repeat protein